MVLSICLLSRVLLFCCSSGRCQNSYLDLENGRGGGGQNVQLRDFAEYFKYGLTELHQTL